MTLAAELDTLSSYVDALPSGGPPARDTAARRRRVVPRLRAHAAREHVRVRRRRVVRRASLFLTALGGAAAALVVVNGWVRLRPAGRANATIAVLDGTLWLEEGAARRALSAGEASGVDARDELESPAERLARVQLSDTATLTLDPASRVGTVLAAASAPEAAPTFEAVKLVRGRAHLQVRKLHGGQRFHVLTPDADVQVRGTEFDVELLDRTGAVGSGPGATCVRVQEGLVAVVARGETQLVAAGQTWGCPSEAPAVTSAPPAAATPAHAVALPSPERHAAPPARPTASDLREQNALFQQALQAERAGRSVAAARLYRRLLDRSPRGPLSAQARANLEVVSRPR
ncbi:MAG TPA: FecR family protein [Polyangia bacterium]|nr:FecR family protein [Polyangia bacterium]